MCVQRNVCILGEDYLLPGDDWGRHSLHLTGKEYLSPSDIVNISRRHEDHRSWRRQRATLYPGWSGARPWPPRACKGKSHVRWSVWELGCQHIRSLTNPSTSVTICSFIPGLLESGFMSHISTCRGWGPEKSGDTPSFLNTHSDQNLIQTRSESGGL